MSELAPDGRGLSRHPWAEHAKLLQRKPGVWHLIEEDINSSMVTYVRKGRQTDLAPLHGRLDVRLRNSYLDGTTRRGQMWAKFDPESRIPSRRMKPPTTQRKVPITDEEVREVRERAKNGESAADIGRAYKVTSSYVSALVRGRWRTSAGGPILGVHYELPDPTHHDIS